MDLFETNNKMIEVMESLEKLIPQLEKLETEYYGFYYKTLLHSQARTEGQREAESKLILAKEPIAEKYLDLKYQVRVLLTMKDMLIEIGKNFRILESRSHIDN
jgi:hypothetical protein